MPGGSGGAPTRLALQTGRLDDERRHLTPDDALWDDACQCFLARDEIDVLRCAEAVSDRWPAREGAPSQREALAVTVALASPFAARDRILRALNGAGVHPEAPAEERNGGPPLQVSPWVVPRPRFPHIYDPDTEQRAPIVAVVDGPSSSAVAQFLETIKKRDEALADAIVLGADLDTLESLDRLSLDAQRAARWELAAKVQQDSERWKRRAEQARARQRLEGSQYGWSSDNFPPGCLEAVRAHIRHEVDVLLEDPPASR